MKNIGGATSKGWAESAPLGWDRVKVSENLGATAVAPVAPVVTSLNSMIRVIYGLRIQNRVNMKNVREKIKMMSVNQIAVYHTLLEAYNVMRHLSSEQIKLKWTIIEKKYALRSVTNNDLKVPEKPKLKCEGFTYNGAKLFNMLPPKTREIKDPNTFKTEMKNWIWENIPSY